MKVSFSYFLVALKRAFWFVGHFDHFRILDLLTVRLGLPARRLLGQEHGLDVGQHSSLRDIEVYISRKVHLQI